jgi:hypothetical protein
LKPSTCSSSRAPISVSYRPISVTHRPISVTGLPVSAYRVRLQGLQVPSGLKLLATSAGAWGLKLLATSAGAAGAVVE